MADYPTALVPLLDNEDGKNRHWFYNSAAQAQRAGDPGLETVHGISRKKWPHWSGWALVDAAKSDPSFPQCLLALPELMTQVEAFYKQYFWDAISGDALNAQDLANQVLDAAVNQGPEVAGELLQKAVNFVDNCLKEDGEIGPKTVAAVNRLCFSADLGLALKKRWLNLRKAWYEALAARLRLQGSVEAEDLSVWLARVVIPGIDPDA